jgi:16S rRNA G966 N2-methylase RsmD
MNKETKQFIIDNRDANIHQVALQQAKYPLVDMPLAIRQINGMQKIKAKVPLFYNNADILYPVQLSLEQSSSESTAKYKANLCEGNTLADLTGGFGVDCSFMARGFKQATYVERQAELCQLATHNFNALNLPHIAVINAETENYLSSMNPVDWIFIDPARRSSTGKKVVLLSDCEPDVSALSSQLLSKAARVLIKLSPMMDITAAVKELPNTAEIHILSVDNECKEVLLLLDHDTHTHQKIKTLNIGKNDKTESFEFQQDEETKATVTYAHTVEKYLYEPNAAVMKSGAFKLIAARYGLRKLQQNTHLYTSDKQVLEFPGRVFEVLQQRGSSKKDLKELSANNSKANITTRNYPLSVEELRKKLNLKDGGDLYLFACTLAPDTKVILECRK